jgi:hypothetical protein
VIRHEERVHGDAVAEVVPAAQSFALEPEGLIQLNRRFVPGKDVQLELAHRSPPCPGDGRLEERAADTAAAMACRNHQPEIRDVGARRVRVAREGEAADDPLAVHSDEDGCVGMTPNRAKVASFVCHAAPRVRGEQPLARLPPDGGGQGDEL